MSTWLSNAVQRAAQSTQVATNPALADQLNSLQWPSRRTEAWRYTSLFSLAEKQFANAVHPHQPANIDGLESLDISFDGQQWHIPAHNIDGLSISVGHSDNAHSPAHLFGTLNEALAVNQLNIAIDDNCTVSPVLHLSVQAQANIEQHARTCISLGRHSKASILEVVTGHSEGLTTLFAEYDIADHAKLEHYRMQQQNGEQFCFGGAHFKLHNHSEIDSHLVGFGGKVSRLDVDVEHAGEHAFAKMNAIYLLDDNEHFDLHTTIEHAQPNGTTEENVRGIVGGSSKAVFNGRIHIHRDAQKTLAELNNRNLLMSRNAEINTKPELEIYADDVRCAHGATVSEIDESSLYYFTSRGIPAKQAQIMLNFGFINELVDQMPHESIAEWLRPQLRQRFAKMTK